MSCRLSYYLPKGHAPVIILSAWLKTQIWFKWISQSYRKIGSKIFDTLNLTRFAVRSSAVGEDSDDLSSAGQNETFLGCKNLDSIFKAVIKCWASLFTHQSVEYRRQNGQIISGTYILGWAQWNLSYFEFKFDDMYQTFLIIYIRIRLAQLNFFLLPPDIAKSLPCWLSQFSFSNLNSNLVWFHRDRHGST